MNTKEFNATYNYAKKTNVATDEYFNFAGFFWIALTEKQLNKMFDLMVEQGCTPDENGYVSLTNGISIRRI